MRRKYGTNCRRNGSIHEVLAQDEKAFLDEWLEGLRGSIRTTGSVLDSDPVEQCSQFLRLFRVGLENTGAFDVFDPRWKELRALLTEISRTRAIQGFTPSETATFVFSFKRPLFRRLREGALDPEQLAQHIWTSSEILDSLASVHHGSLP